MIPPVTSTRSLVFSNRLPMAATSRWNPSNWAAASSRAEVVRFSSSRAAASFSWTARKSPTRSRSRFNSLPRSSRAVSLAVISASFSRSAAAEDQLLPERAPPRNAQGPKHHGEDNRSFLRAAQRCRRQNVQFGIGWPGCSFEEGRGSDLILRNAH